MVEIRQNVRHKFDQIPPRPFTSLLKLLKPLFHRFKTLCVEQHFIRYDAYVLKALKVNHLVIGIKLLEVLFACRVALEKIAGPLS